MKTNIAKNSVSLLAFQIIKVVFPLITLPYLTRVLSVASYGVVSYVKTIMLYMQLVVDFGFVLSGTRDIVKAKSNHQKVQSIINSTYTARLILGLIGFIATIIISLVLPITRNNLLFAILSYLPIFGTIFLFDFFFRGIEKMHIITIRFAVMKILSTIATFLFIKSDAQLLLIPIFDIIATTIAAVLVFFEMRKSKYQYCLSSLGQALKKIKESFVFFLSNAASTSLSAISTILIGILLSETEVAYWGLAMQIIGTIQACYAPISEAIYPEMIRSKNLSLIKKILAYATPVIIAGTILTAVLSGWVFLILGGEKYVAFSYILKITSLCLLFGFFAIILGWPTLGAISKNKETTISTIISLLINIIGILILAICGGITLVNIAIVRVLSDLSLFVVRAYFVFKNRQLYTKEARL